MRSLTTALLLLPLLASCNWNGSPASPAPATSPATVSQVVPGASVVQAGHRFIATYRIGSPTPVENVVVTFHLLAAGTGASEAGYAGADLVSELSDVEGTGRSVVLQVPEDLPVGAYVLEARVDEVAAGDAEPPRARSTAEVQVQTALATTTNLIVLAASLDTVPVILDPHLDLTTVLDTSIDSLAAGLADLYPDPADLTARLAGLQHHSQAEVHGTLTLAYDGPRPSGPAQLSAQVQIGGAWVPIRLFDSVAEAYADAVAITFPTTDEALGLEPARELTVDLHLDLSAATLQALAEELIANVADPAAVAAGYNTIGLRLVVTQAGTEADATDNLLELRVPAYALPTVVAPSITVTDEDSRKAFEASYAKSAGDKHRFRAGISCDSRFEIVSTGTEEGASARVRLQVPMHAFGEAFTLASANLSAGSYVKPTSKLGYAYDLSFFGTSLVSREHYEAEHELYRMTKSWNREKRLGRHHFAVGPVPFEVTVYADGTLGYDLSLGLVSDGLHLSGPMPHLDFRITADGGPTIGVASAGITAQFTLIDDRLATDARLSFSYDQLLDGLVGGEMTLLATNYLKLISGKLGMYVRVNYLLGEKTYRHWIYQTDPLFRQTTTLYRKSLPFTFAPAGDV